MPAGIAVLVGVVVGVGIFGFPPLVAGYVDTAWGYMGLWLAGGLVMLVGALCYAELGSAWPDEGGEYHFLTRAYGNRVGMLFAWARGTVIQTGAIAVVAFIYGDYAQQLVSLGTYGPALHAAIAVVALTALNLAGTLHSQRVQVTFTVLTLAAIAIIVVAGLAIGADQAPALSATPAPVREGSLFGALGMGMVFVLLTYGGWNEAAYLSGELRDVRRNMSRVLLLGTAIVVVTYVLVNLAFLSIFGLDGLRGLDAAGAALMQVVAGPWAAVALSLLICCTALSTINATILTGARVYYALGRDIPALHQLATWDARGSTPTRALLLQAVITLALVLLGALTGNGSGVETLVAYTAPVFWIFMLLIALSVLVLRKREPERARPFKVPLYPLTPILFALSCAGLIFSSTLYAGVGALVGLAVLAAGIPLLWLYRPATPSSPTA